MKALISIISLMSILTLNSMGQKSNIKGLLEKPETRKEIFNAIMNDHALMTEFMQAMHENEHAMMMMRGDNQIMMGHEGQMGINIQNQIMNRNSMVNMMHQNPGMMKMMMSNMMNVVETDSTMCHNMVNMMTCHHQMMQMMRQSLNQEGMMMDNKMMMHNK